MVREIWKPINETYQVSNLGRIKSEDMVVNAINNSKAISDKPITQFRNIDSFVLVNPPLENHLLMCQHDLPLCNWIFLKPQMANNAMFLA